MFLELAKDDHMKVYAKIKSLQKIIINQPYTISSKFSSLKFDLYSHILFIHGQWYNCDQFYP
jgi:Txe/YoeB family toxin of Txe-Axe toxin-antitoxin module